MQVRLYAAPKGRRCRARKLNLVCKTSRMRQLAVACDRSEIRMRAVRDFFRASRARLAALEPGSKALKQGLLSKAPRLPPRGHAPVAACAATGASPGRLTCISKVSKLSQRPASPAVGCCLRPCRVQGHRQLWQPAGASHHPPAAASQPASNSRCRSVFMPVTPWYGLTICLLHLGSVSSQLWEFFLNFILFYVQKQVSI